MMPNKAHMSTILFARRGASRNQASSDLNISQHKAVLIRRLPKDARLVGGLLVKVLLTHLHTTRVQRHAHAANCPEPVASHSCHVRKCHWHPHMVKQL